MTAGVNCGSPQPLQRLNTKATTKRRSESHSACDSYVRFGVISGHDVHINSCPLCNQKRTLLALGSCERRYRLRRPGIRECEHQNLVC